MLIHQLKKELKERGQQVEMFREETIRHICTRRFTRQTEKNETLYGHMIVNPCTSYIIKP